MPDEPSLGEVVRRLDRLEARFEEVLRELSLRMVSTDIYNRDQREVERRFTELERDLLTEIDARKTAVADERALREAADQQLATRMDKGGANWRQAVYSGLLPALFFLVSIAVTIMLARGK